MQKMPPIVKRNANLPKPRNEGTPQSIDETVSDIPLPATDGYERSVSEYYSDLYFVSFFKNNYQ